MPKYAQILYIYKVCPYNLTFAISRNLYRQADDPYQVLYGHQRPEDGSDSKSLTLAGLNQLWIRTVKKYGERLITALQPHTEPMCLEAYKKLMV